MRTGRSLLLSVGALGMIALCAAAILSVGPRTDEASMKSAPTSAKENRAELAKPAGGKGESDPIHLDAHAYAKGNGVSLEEADRRLDMQGDTLPSDLERTLKNTEPDTFAGLWIRHRPDFGITVATSGDPEDTMEKIQPIVTGTQWEGTVNVKRVEASEAELRAARAEAERMLDRLGVRYSSGDNIMKNRIEIYVKDKSRVERKLRASGQQLPEHVALIEDWIRPS